MKTQVQTVTPEIASRFLQKNQGNRDYRKSWIAHLSRIIQNGEWMVTHQGIALDKAGNLIDGQHRLLAIIDSGIPVEMNVTYDAESSTFGCIDIGVKRNLADITRFNKKTAEVCSVMFRFLSIGRQKFPTAIEATQIYKNGVGKLSEELNEFANKNVKFYSSAPFRLAAILMIMDGHNKEYVFNLYYNLTNLSMDKLPPIAHSLIRQVHNYSINLHEKSYTIARALKVFDEKRANTQLVLTASDLASVIPYARTVYKNYAAQKANNG